MITVFSFSRKLEVLLQSRIRHVSTVLGVELSFQPYSTSEYLTVNSCRYSDSNEGRPEYQYFINLI